MTSRSYYIKEPHEESHPLFSLDIVVPGCDTWNICLHHLDSILMKPTWRWADLRDAKNWHLWWHQWATPSTKPSSEHTNYEMSFYSSVLFKTAWGRISVPYNIKHPDPGCMFSSLSFLEWSNKGSRNISNVSKTTHSTFWHCQLEEKIR